MSNVNEWQHLKIPLKEIEVATENFKTLIGRGGYGWVYKGKLPVSGKETMVAVKRLNEQHGQGLKEFLTEIQLLSGQHHPNLISLVGYCDEGKEKTIVYEYAEHGSLDQYIRRTRKTTSPTLTWLQRLMICADAARGLDYLHRHVGGHRTIIHRDIKSSNILIDENWVAKISDLGLSKLSVTGYGMSLLVSNGCGTQGYCEPEYYTTGFVTKKSDVYSFGVVLFEVLCGRLCLIDSDDGFSLSGMSAKEYFKNNNLDKIIDQSLREHIGSYSMNKFAAIAYRCLHDDREQRPAMDVVVEELKEALEYQRDGFKSLSHEDDIDDDEYWEKKLPKNYQCYIKMSDKPLNYTTKMELYHILCHGFLADKGQLWFSMCKSTHGICSLLSADKISSFRYQAALISPSESRFSFVTKLDDYKYFLFKATLESVMFSPLYTYACYLLFKIRDDPSTPDNTVLFKTDCELDGVPTGTMFVYCTYPLNVPTIKPKNDQGLDDSSNIPRVEGIGMTNSQMQHLGYTWIEERKDGWMEAMLFKLTNKLPYLKNGVHLRIELRSIEDRMVNGMIIEGIEFRPYIQVRNAHQ